MRCIAADALPAQPWRNGGGRTRELFAAPAGAGWRVRLSLADIDADGPFSACPGVTRWFAVLEGAGVELTLDGRPRPLTPASAPLCFDGAAAPGCRLLQGRTRDLNLMLRGVRGTLQRARPGRPWDTPWPWRAAFCAGAATLHAPDGTAHRLAARTLATGLPAGPLRLDAADPQAPLFWIGAECTA